MVPQTVNGDYGYSDRALDATRYEVTYVSPRLRADVDSDADHGLEGEKQRVYEFALWRAAQLADSKDYPAFKVAQESRDVDVTVNWQHTVPPPYFGPWGYRHWPYGPYGYWPYDYGYGWPGYYTQSTASGRITVKLTVELLANVEPGAMDTAATLDRLRKVHGSAGYRS